MSLSKQVVLDRLNRLTGPDGGPLGQSPALSEIVIAQDKVYFSIAVDSKRAGELEVLRKAAETAVSSLPGVTAAIVSLTAEVPKGVFQSPPPAPPAPAARGQPPASKPLVPGVKHIIAVASGKGGVGKSTTAANLALGLKGLSLRIGVLDADIYGPSMPKLFALSGRPSVKEGRILIPLEAHGLKVMSIGFLVDEDQAMIWRGPMVMSAITQMLREVDWGELDVLVVDMPPGTGDAQLTMAQNVPLAGSVIVSTPQDMALIDARRGVAMFNKVSIPILGIIENMSYFIAPDTGARYDIFGHGGAKAEALRLGVPFLGEVPLDMEIRERSDRGVPITVGNPDSIHAETYRSIAKAVWAQLSSGAVGKPPPRIVYE